MSNKKLFPLVITAITAVIFSISICFLIGSGTSELNGQQDDSTESENASSDSDISNNVQNNVNGEHADVSNSIGNHLDDSNNNQLENNITNNINVNVGINVTNNIANNVNGNKQDSNNNNNEGDNNQSNNQDNNTDNTNGNNNNENESNESSGNELVWGVDSASLTTDNLLACVQENYGTPEIWGRYLGDKEGVSAGITPEEVDLLHSNDIKILVIWNHFTDATGFENGQNVAREAIQKAQEDGVPEGVALFADIEPTYPVDSDFIRGWYQVMSESEYNPGIYGSFDSDTPLYQAFQQASETNAEIKENTYIWTAVPKVGITTEANAPDYQPSAPEDGLIAGWQYGIEAQTCNIDTNLFNSNVLDGVLW